MSKTNLSSYIKQAMLVTALAYAAPCQSATGFTINGSKLLDANGQEFIMRGINHAHAWYAKQINTTIPAIAATNANTVRIALATGDRWTRTSASEIRDIIRLLKAHKMIAVLEVHDCTGWSEQSGSVALSRAVDFWLSSDIKAELVGQEAYVIINIANEPHGNTTTASYISDHKTAITRLRSGGFQHTLMVDAANWGQDWTNTTRDNAGQILAADPTGNILFSVHMYEVYDTEAKVDTYLNTFNKNHWALVVGEFADDHGTGRPVAEDAIMRLTTQYGQGYLGWSWMGNGSPLEGLDIVTAWNGSNLTTWGDKLINGTYGLRAKATPASVFTAASSSNSPRPSISSFTASSPGCGTGYEVKARANAGWKVKPHPPSPE